MTISPLKSHEEKDRKTKKVTFRFKASVEISASDRCFKVIDIPDCKLIESSEWIGIAGDEPKQTLSGDF